ncbi:Bifunctional+protein+HldE [Methylocapsa aurea]|uniref:D-glycero-beta-D-manno-heptose 1-phosphate adenylyltransferase n=1 Tax=Methylocapsa aurea TaxID=663610 RepID=UPI003D18DDFB
MNWFETTVERPAKILVVGDAMVDQYIIGEISRISPEAPVPVLLVREESDKAGGAANVAANVAAMGGDCRLLGIVGDDGGRMKLERLMEALHVRHDLVVDSSHITTQKTRLICGTQQIARIDREAAPSAATLRALREKFEEQVREADLVVFSDYDKGALRELPMLIDLARKSGRRTLVDPKLADPEFYRGAYILKPNEAEFRILFGAFTEETLIEKAAAALRKFDIDHIVLTRGPKGMLLVSADGTVIERPTEAIEVFDVSGAGDTVAAALAISVASGWSLEDAVTVSNVAAGIAVAHAGTYVVSRYDIDTRLATRTVLGAKLLSRLALVKLIAARRASGAQIVFTNGCFDILHSGHVRALAAARKEGDILIVALNSDESVQRLKGPTRPINHLADRVEVIAALGCVDFVTEFSEDTPYELIKLLEPDVLVKGGDYATDQIVGADIVIERGGRVVLVQYHEGHSSTQMIDRIAAA